MISNTLAAVAQVGIIAFVVASMLGAGMSLTLHQVTDPLRNGRLVAAMLLANFAAVPALAYGLAKLLPMDPPAETAMVLLGAMAGAPFLPKMAGMSKGNVPFSVGLMVLLMVVTVGYAPVIVPWLIEGVELSAWDIAKSLIFLMLIPLAVGLFVRARYAEHATGWAPDLSKISTLALLIGFVAAVLVSYEDVFGAVGTWIFLGAVLLALLSFVTGWIFSYGSDAETRRVAGLGTAQRNLSAALLAAATNFDGNAIVLTMVASLALGVTLMLSAAELGKFVATGQARAVFAVTGRAAFTARDTRPVPAGRHGRLTH
jgi:BASS family bile acid:Na+ symporter